MSGGMYDPNFYENDEPWKQAQDSLIGEIKNVFTGKKALDKDEPDIEEDKVTQLIVFTEAIASGDYHDEDYHAIGGSFCECAEDMAKAVLESVNTPTVEPIAGHSEWGE